MDRIRIMLHGKGFLGGDYHKGDNPSVKFCGYACNEFYASWAKNMGNIGKISCTPVSEVCLSLLQFS